MINEQAANNQIDTLNTTEKLSARIEMTEQHCREIDLYLKDFNELNELKVRSGSIMLGLF